MKNFNCQSLKHERTWSILPVTPMSAALEGYNTSSIRGINDQRVLGGFIEGEKIPRI